MKARRRVIVGIGNQGTAPIVEWLITAARPDDEVCLVHALEPWPALITAGAVPVEDEELMHEAEARHLAQVADQVRTRRPKLKLSTVLARRSTADALRQMGVFADLVVVGALHHAGSRWALQELTAHADCPLLVLPEPPAEDPSKRRSVAVLVRELASDRPVVDAAFCEAAARGVGLTVLHPWHPAADETLPYGETSEQISLGGYLSEWQDEFPTVAVNTVVRLHTTPIEFDSPAATITLLVVGTEPGRFWAPGPMDPIVTAALKKWHGPVLLVPREPVPAQRIHTDHVAAL